MRPLKAPVRDPAPSRASYRMQRLWLTPFFRSLLRIGMPLALVALGAGWIFGQQEYREAAQQKFAEIRRSVEERPEFMVQLMAIDGASVDVAQEIREIVPVDLPISSFDLDLAAMKDRIALLDAVARVDLHIRRGGVLQVKITERLPAVVWRIGRSLDLLDIDGHRVTNLGARPERADLPLLAGAGADSAVPQALAVLAVTGPVKDRVRGLVRIGERRWDLVLDRDQRILLPEHEPVLALEQVMALEQATELLARDIVIVDMRNKNRPTLRLARPNGAQLSRINQPEPGEVQQ